MSGELVTVATFNDPIEAAMARNYLEADGVRAFLLDEQTIATNWGLANAVGGIKLQVYSGTLEQAEFLLSQLGGDRDEPPVASTAIATPETAAELREEDEHEAPKDQAVDRLFRVAVFGLVFWPLQLFARFLLLSLLGMDGPMSPGRRWKVWVSVLLNFPLIAVIVIPLMCLVGR